MSMLTVSICVSEKEELTHFAVLLAQLQPQLAPDDDIYVVDATEDRSALKTARKFKTSRNVVLVETTPGVAPFKAAFESALDNSQEAVLFLSPYCFISNTFIGNLKQALRNCESDQIIPRIQYAPYGRIDPNFNSWNPTIRQLPPTTFGERECYLARIDVKFNHSASELSNELVVVHKPTQGLEAIT
jgi:GT2 family glycosyltransferase